MLPSKPAAMRQRQATTAPHHTIVQPQAAAKSSPTQEPHGMLPNIQDQHPCCSSLAPTSRQFEMPKMGAVQPPIRRSTIRTPPLHISSFMFSSRKLAAASSLRSQAMKASMHASRAKPMPCSRSIAAASSSVTAISAGRSW